MSLLWGVYAYRMRVRCRGRGYLELCVVGEYLDSGSWCCGKGGARPSTSGKGDHSKSKLLSMQESPDINSRASITKSPKHCIITFGLPQRWQLYGILPTNLSSALSYPSAMRLFDPS